MKSSDLKRALAVSVRAAKGAGKMMRANWRSPKKINSQSQHDIKLELDVRCQKEITRILQSSFPDVPVLGEEATTGDVEEQFRWVVDPIDGTVNFTYGIPHACVSVALQGRKKGEFETLVGAVYDPFCDELWTAVRGQRAQLNGRAIRVSSRKQLKEAIVSMGFAKEKSTLAIMLPVMNALIPEVRKIRIMGSAALSMVYVATGRTDIYTEYGVRLWDIAAGGLILECAGGEFWNREVDNTYGYHVIANNGLLRARLEEITGALAISSF